MFKNVNVSRRVRIVLLVTVLLLVLSTVLLPTECAGCKQGGRGSYRPVWGCARTYYYAGKIKGWTCTGGVYEPASCRGGYCKYYSGNCLTNYYIHFGNVKWRDVKGPGR